MSSFQEKIKNPAKFSSVHYWSIFDCLQLFPTNDGILKSQIEIVSDIMKNCSKQYE